MILRDYVFVEVLWSFLIQNLRGNSITVHDLLVQPGNAINMRCVRLYGVEHSEIIVKYVEQ